MGDVPLGMYALIYRIREFLPNAKITFLVRGGLSSAFSLLEGVSVWAAEEWKRGKPFDLKKTLAQQGRDLSSFDLVLENPDPTYWVRWQLGVIVPKLRWDPSWDCLVERFALVGRGYVGLHVHSETLYGYEKNWPVAHWQELCRRIILETGSKVILFGLKPTADFAMEGVIDLRGNTSLLELLAVIKNRCRYLVAPDSGVLSLVYYLNTPFPLRVVSLWADPRQGVLKQNVPSPNPQLIHLPLLGKGEEVSNISVESVLKGVAIPIGDPLLLKQRNAVFDKQPTSFTALPLKEWKTPAPSPLGAQRIGEGKVGCLVLAGGEGSRLGLELPKALVPITPIMKKTLLQVFCEKTAAASLQAGTPLSIAIMTSEKNHLPIADYLEAHHFFGLEREQVSLFKQGVLPLLNDQGYREFTAEGEIAVAPDGNGGALHHFFHSGVWDQWRKRGIEYLNLVLIDNPLANPFDPTLVGAHQAAGAEMTLKAIGRETPQESVGVVGIEGGKIQVIEYFELPEAIRSSPDWRVANISLFCFDMGFIKKVADVELPYHVARKKGFWKFERFIFDLLPFAEKVEVVVYPRDEVYAPLKNSCGDSSFATVSAALIAQDRKIYAAISGISPPETPFELDFRFHYPTQELKEAWKGKPLPDSSYIPSVIDSIF